MEVFMRSIPYGVDEWQIIRALEPILHGPMFHELWRGAPYNFIVNPLKGKNGRNHSGCAKLVVPTEAIGKQIIRVMQQNPFFLHGRRILFSQSKFPARADDLAALAEPYQDPEVLEKQQRRKERLEGAIGLKDLRFGWPCHDETISIEWQAPSSESWSLEFDTESHQIMLKSSSKLRICIVLKGVQSTALDSKECVFWLERPPIFEVDKQGAMSYTDAVEAMAEGLSSMSLRSSKATRKRLTSLDPKQARIFAFLRVICITFEGDQASNDFRSRAKIVNLTTYGGEHKFMNHRLFSPSVFDHLDKWLAYLPFDVAFQLDALISRGRFNPRELCQLAQEFEQARHKYGNKVICAVIRGLEQDREEFPSSSAADLLKSSLRHQERAIKRAQRGQPKSSSDEIFLCHRVMVTPTSFVLNGPLPDETNRVIRKYIRHQDNFLRVEFREEDRLQMRWDREVDGDEFLDTRVGGVLLKGLTIAGRKFEFLAYSSSALKEHAVWFMTPFRTAEGVKVTADSIRQSLGDFSRVIYCPARYGARIAQAFSTTEPSVTIEADEMHIIPDICSTSGSLFTDGVGTISPDLAEEIWEIYTESRSKRSRRRFQTPSAYQIRLGGLKGMLSVDERLVDQRIVCIRDSMDKFKAPDRMVEIAQAFDRPMLVYLNRPLIMLLETLGVPATPFMDMQREAVRKTVEASKSIDEAADLLAGAGLGTAFNMTSVLRQLYKTNVDLVSRGQDKGMAPFLRRSLKFAVNHILRDLKYKARIPVKRAWTLVGVADEYKYLKEGEIYAYVCNTDGKKEYIEGPVLISRSPTVHPGDARMVRGVGKLPASAPAGLRAMTNCVVFNCKGERSLPSMLGGGDLDGDIYCLILDERLHPRLEHKPASYAAPELVKLDRPSTSRDVAMFVVNYIKNDLLGKIATQILLTADLSPACMADPNCIILASLHSDAVDFPKTGRHVEFGQLPKLNTMRKPDWWAGELNEKNPLFYKSTRIIGELFRDIELPAIPEAQRVAKRQYRQIERETDEDFQAKAVHAAFRKDANIISTLLRVRLREYVDLEEFERGNKANLIEEMLEASGRYSGELAYICRTHSLSMWTQLSEEEVVAGTIVAKCSQHRMRQDTISAMRRDSSGLCTTVREEIEGPEGTSREDQILRGWTAWKTAIAFEDAFGTKSFGLLALDVIFSAIRAIDA